LTGNESDVAHHFRFTDGADVIDVHVDVDIQRVAC